MFDQQNHNTTLARFNMVAPRIAISKHRQFDSQTGKHIPGRCHIGDRSGLRKLMRAQRHGKVPQERIQICVQAQRSAIANAPDYMSGHARRAAGIVLGKDGRWVVPQPVKVDEVSCVDSDNRSKTYSVKSNAARAAAKHGVERSALFEVAGGWAFDIPAVQA